MVRNLHLDCSVEDSNTHQHVVSIHWNKKSSFYSSVFFL